VITSVLSILSVSTPLAVGFWKWRGAARTRAKGEQPPIADRLHVAMAAANAVGWDWDVRTGRDAWFGDLQTMFGLPGEIYEGRVEDFRQRVHPDDRELVWRAVADSRQHRTPYRAQFRVVRTDGQLRWVDAVGAFQYASNGEAVRMTGIAQDVTARRLLETALHESDSRFRLMADAAPVMIWMARPDKRCDYVNARWLEFTGRPLDRELGDGWTDRIHPEDRRCCVEIYERAFEARETFRIEYRLMRHDGEYRWILDTGAPRVAPDGAFAGYIGSCIDVTEHRAAQAALSGLSQKLMDAQESERSRVARELHDDVGQRMALLTIELERLGQDPPKRVGDLRLRLKELYDRTVGMGRDIQNISRRLHSSKLEYLGLAAAAAALCKQIREQHGLETVFSYDGVPSNLPKGIALGLFRVLEESLLNTVKHSGVRQATVTLAADRREIQLSVADAGSGFDLAAALGGPGLGIVSMQERLRSVNGEVAIDTRPGGGTRVSARVPL
jgi:PAS domain S-box-containing protein